MVGKLRDMRDQSRRVLILGSGPLASTLIEEIESAQNPRYTVAGTVDDQIPEPGSSDHKRWLGPCDALAEVVNRVNPAFIIVALADRRDRLPLQTLLDARTLQVVRRIEPDAKRHAAYRPFYEAYKETYAALADTLHRQVAAAG